MVKFSTSVNTNSNFLSNEYGSLKHQLGVHHSHLMSHMDKAAFVCTHQSLYCTHTDRKVNAQWRSKWEFSVIRKWWSISIYWDFYWLVYIFQNILRIFCMLIIRLLLLAWKKHECLCFLLDWCLPVLKCSLIIFFLFQILRICLMMKTCLKYVQKTLVFVGFPRKDSNVIYVPEYTCSSHYCCTGKQPCNEMNCWWECVWKYFVYWLWTCP